MNQLPGGFPSHVRKIVRIPMRHTFTVEQKQILLRYFENGMIGQSLAYHDKILHCAHESGLDFEVVKNWVGNQRRKRRMVEMQTVCDQFSPDQKMEFMDQMVLNKEGPNKMSRTSEQGEARQSQLMFFPRSGSAVNMHERSMNSATNSQASDTLQSSSKIQQQQFSGEDRLMSTKSYQNDSLSQEPLPQSMARVHDETAFSLAPSSPQMHHQKQYQGQKVHQIAHEEYASTSNSLTHSGTRYIFENYPSSYRNSMSRGSLHQVNRDSRTQNDLTFGRGRFISHERPIQQDPCLSQEQQFQDDSGFTQTGHNHKDQHLSVEGIVSRHMDDVHFHVDIQDAEWRDQQVQKIMEAVQSYVDQLHKFGCETFLAAVSKDTFSTYLCGTNVGNDYFTKVNTTLPISEYVERVTARDYEGDKDVSLPEVKLEEKVPEKEESSQVTCETREGTTEVQEGEEKDDTSSAGTVINSGEEVFIVSKDHFIIGKGYLLPSPHQKVEVKKRPQTEESDDIIDEDGFIDNNICDNEKEAALDE